MRNKSADKARQAGTSTLFGKLSAAEFSRYMSGKQKIG